MDHSAHHPDGAESSYAGYVEREIKALSPDEREALLAGEGMGMALAAELNGYPGPRHVLELSEDLGLDERQRQRMDMIFRAMKESAQRLGASIVRAEAELDRAFATREITGEELDRRVAEIADLRAALRTAHLEAHLDAREVLDEVQVRRYQELRGYSSVRR